MLEKKLHRTLRVLASRASGNNKGVVAVEGDAGAVPTFPGVGATPCEIVVNGRPVQVAADVTLLAALQSAGYGHTRVSLSGERRGALCGMGICYECRVRVNGVTQRSCLTPVRPGLVVTLQGTEGQDVR